MAAVALWLPALTSSLWLDETGTVWLLRGGVADALSHSLYFQGGSPLYYLVEWSDKALFGTSELALRAPSVAGMILAAWLVFLLGRRLFDSASGAIAALVFVALPIVGFAAGDARPYALAMAALAGSALALVRWLERGTSTDAVVYALSFAATVYLHYLFALALLAHGVYVLARMKAGTPVTSRRLLAVYAAIAVLVAPAAPNVLRVLSQRGVLSNPFPRTPAEVLAGLFPGVLALTLVIAFALAAIVWRPRGGPWKLDDGAVVFLLAWIGVTFVTLVAISEIGSADVLVPRYFMPVIPPVALLVGAGVGRLGSAWAQVAVAGVVVVVSLVEFTSWSHTAEDWRAAAELERSLVDDASTPVLLFSGFIEAQQRDWLRDADKESYLNAPASAYGFDGDVIALPFGLDPDSDAYMEELVGSRLEPAGEFVLVTRGSDPFQAWLADHVPGSLSSTLEGSFGGEVLVYRFERS